jgi:hypothetical protein
LRFARGARASRRTFRGSEGRGSLALDGAASGVLLKIRISFKEPRGEYERQMGVDEVQRRAGEPRVGRGGERRAGRLRAERVSNGPSREGGARLTKWWRSLGDGAAGQSVSNGRVLLGDGAAREGVADGGVLLGDGAAREGISNGRVLLGDGAAGEGVADGRVGLGVGGRVEGELDGGHGWRRSGTKVRGEGECEGELSSEGERERDTSQRALLEPSQEQRSPARLSLKAKGEQRKGKRVKSSSQVVFQQRRMHNSLPQCTGSPPAPRAPPQWLPSKSS